MTDMIGSDEIEVITELLGELKDNYYDLMRMLDDLEDDSVESVLDDDYKRIIDAIRGVQEYL